MAPSYAGPSLIELRTYMDMNEHESVLHTCKPRPFKRSTCTVPPFAVHHGFLSHLSSSFLCLPGHYSCHPPTGHDYSAPCPLRNQLFISSLSMFLVEQPSYNHVQQIQCRPHSQSHVFPLPVLTVPHLQFCSGSFLHSHHSYRKRNTARR